MGRKSVNTAEYFPHSANQSKTLQKLRYKFGSNGYAFYYQLKELLANTEDHFLNISDKSEFDFIVVQMAIPEDQVLSMIEDLISWNELDSELYIKHGVIWWDNFVKKDLYPLYQNRKRDMPDKPDFSTNNYCRNDSQGELLQINTDNYPKSTQSTAQHSAAQESIEKQSTEKNSSESENDFSNGTIFTEEELKIVRSAGLVKKPDAVDEIIDALDAEKEKKATQTEAAKNLTPEQIFEQCRTTYDGIVRGYETELENLKKKNPKNWQEIPAKIRDNLKTWAIRNEILERQGKFVAPWPSFQVYINQKRWEAYPPKLNQNGIKQNNQSATTETSREQLANKYAIED